MTPRATKIVVATVTLVTVAGLIALATPAISAVWDAVIPLASASSPSSPADPAAAPTSEQTAEPATPSDPAGPPSGYVDVGHGTSIPAGGPGECTASAYIWIGSDEGEPMRAEMTGADLVDMGPREFAVGDVGLDEQGRPATYTVAPGDVLTRIGDRFCIYNGMTLATLNNYPGGAIIQPGDILTLNADHATDFVYPYPID